MTRAVNLEVGPAVAIPVMSHLRSRAEAVAFMRGEVSGDDVLADEATLLGDDSLVLSDWHVTMTEDARQSLMAWASGASALVEAHSHGEMSGPVAFSITDLKGLRAWLPHLTWRLPGLTYVALVFGSAATFDGLAWRAGTGPLAVNRISFDEVGAWHATGHSIRKWEQIND